MRKLMAGVLAVVLMAGVVGGAWATADTEVVTVTPAPKLRTLKSGSKGEEVVRLQERLAELGYFTLAPDGKYSAETKAAVKTFQAANGLKADGVAGVKTLTLLYSDEAIAAPKPVDVLAGEYPMLVNKEHPVPETFVPQDLVMLTDECDAKLVKIKYPQTQAVKTAVDALVTMLEAAKEDGITNWQISAAYRSYQKQVTTLNAKINTYLERNKDWSKNKARKAALKTVAEPGCSEHHTGLAFDINVPKSSAFKGTKQCTWLHEHCWDYGFIVRYQEGKENITGFTAEAWHIRYVGVEHAKIMQKNNWCLEEYLEAVAAETPDEEETLDEEDPLTEDEVEMSDEEEIPAEEDAETPDEEENLTEEEMKLLMELEKANTKKPDNESELTAESFDDDDELFAENMFDPGELE